MAQKSNHLTVFNADIQHQI